MEKEFESLAKNGIDTAIAIIPGTVKDCRDVVRDGGKVITVSGDDQIQSEREIVIKQFIHQLNFKKAMSELIQAISENKLKVFIQHIYSFDEAEKALMKTESRHARGKNVVFIEE